MVVSNDADDDDDNAMYIQCVCAPHRYISCIYFMYQCISCIVFKLIGKPLTLQNVKQEWSYTQSTAISYWHNSINLAIAT